MVHFSFCFIWRQFVPTSISVILISLCVSGSFSWTLPWCITTISLFLSGFLTFFLLTNFYSCTPFPTLIRGAHFIIMDLILDLGWAECEHELEKRRLLEAYTPVHKKCFTWEIWKFNPAIWLLRLCLTEITMNFCQETKFYKALFVISKKMLEMT